MSFLPALAPPHDARPLRWWSARELAQIALCANLAWSRWTKGWLDAIGVAGAEVRLAHEVEDAAEWNWSPLGSRDGATAWVACPTGAAAWMRRVLFDDAAGQRDRPDAPPIAASLANRAWLSLLDAMREQLKLDAPVSQAGLADTGAFKSWSGWVVLLLPLARSRIPILLDAACVETLVGLPLKAGSHSSAPALTPLMDALAEQGVSLRIELEPCELDLGALEELRLGDVVPLPHELDKPLRLHLKGQFLCEGFLGRHQGLKAIELLRPALHDFRN